jgi:altronate dehydratase large subunit
MTATTNVSAYRRTDGRLAVRRRRLILPGVSCANVVCDRLAARHPDLAVIRHQHGCGQVGGDLELTRETLAALASHPNVERAILIALGCETNQGIAVVRRARERGGTVDLVSIQAAGGIEAAVARSEELAVQAGVGWDRAPVDPAALRVAVLADAPADRKAPQTIAAIAGTIEAAGFTVLTCEPGSIGDRPGEAQVHGHAMPTRGVPRLWRTDAGDGCGALAAVRAGGTETRLPVSRRADDVARLTALTALGAHLAVFVTGRGTPIGSPVAPTVKVSVDPTFDALDDVIDVRAEGEDLPGRVVAAVIATAGGRPTNAERAGMRDVELLRTAPFF